MRKFIRIIENASIPSWFTAGSLLSDDDLERLHAGFYIEDVEWTYEWRLCQVPVALLPSLTPDEIKAMDDEEPGRMDSVRRLMQRPEDIKNLPIVLTLRRNGRLKEFLDGWHRATAAKEMGLPTIWAVVGLPPDRGRELP